LCSGIARQSNAKTSTSTSKAPHLTQVKEVKKETIASMAMDDALVWRNKSALESMVSTLTHNQERKMPN
jgi:hypothetical protein